MPIMLTNREMEIVLHGLVLAEDEAEAIGDTTRVSDCRRLLRTIVSYHEMQIEIKREVRY